MILCFLVQHTASLTYLEGCCSISCLDLLDSAVGGRTCSGHLLEGCDLELDRVLREKVLRKDVEAANTFPYGLV